MEYFRDPENQIYADIAYRLGKIVYQYEDYRTDSEKYEATLLISVLQTLLTNLSEHIRGLSTSQYGRKLFNVTLSEDQIVGITSGCIIKNTFNEPCTLSNTFSHLRNALSHPTKLKKDVEFPSTGYFTSKRNKLIEDYYFVDSPDTKNNRVKRFNDEEIESYIKANKQTLPKDIISFDDNGAHIMILNEEPFARIAIIKLSIKQLKSLVIQLANYLAQPIQHNWDGITIKDLFAA